MTDRIITREISAHHAWQGPESEAPVFCNDGPQLAALGADIGIPISGAPDRIWVRSTGNGNGGLYSTVDRSDAGPCVEYVRKDLAAPAVKVKPLAWVERHDILGLHSAKGEDGYWYNVQQYARNSFAYEGHPSDMPNSIRVTCDTLEAAKAAAQADYEARILSALEGAQ